MSCSSSALGSCISTSPSCCFIMILTCYSLWCGHMGVGGRALCLCHVFSSTEQHKLCTWTTTTSRLIWSLSFILFQTRGLTPGCWSTRPSQWPSSSWFTWLWSGLDLVWWSTGSQWTWKPFSSFTTSPWSACPPTCSTRSASCAVLARKPK